MSDEKDAISEAADIAVQQFQTLDFSEKSMEEVESILNVGSEMFKEMPEKVQQEKIEVLGSYILEVARRMFGGELAWHEGYKQPLLVVQTENSRVALMTWKKVKGRLSGDLADNIPYFFNGFVIAVRADEPGQDILCL